MPRGLAHPVRPTRGVSSLAFAPPAPVAFTGMDDLEGDIRAGIADAIILRKDWSRWKVTPTPCPERACWRLRIEMDGSVLDLPLDLRLQYLTDDVIRGAQPEPGHSRLRVAARRLASTLLDLIGA